MQRLLNHYVALVQGNRVVAGRRVPRYAETLLARHVPFYVVDHPEFCKKVETACTDGRVVFVNADFMEKLVTDEKENGGSNLVPVLLHELEHIMLRHCQRKIDWLSEERDASLWKLMNIAQDYYINGRIRQGYFDTGEITPGKMILDTGIGFDEESAAWSAGKTTLEIYHELLAMRNEGKPFPGMDDRQGEGGDMEGDPSMPGGGGDMEGGPSMPGGGGDIVLDPKGLRDLLDGIGAGEAADRLGLPKSGDEDALREYEKRGRDMAINAVSETKKKYDEVKSAGGEMPGGHIIDDMYEQVGLGKEPVLTLLTAFRNLLAAGDGHAFRWSPDLENQYVDYGAGLVNMGMSIPRSEVPLALVILDTSGSMSNEELSASLAEILNFVVASDGDMEVLLAFADTVVRGDLIRVNEETAKDILDRGTLNVRGRGGTSIREVIGHAWNKALEEPDASLIHWVMYFTDLCDELPKKHDLPEALLKNSVFKYVTLSGGATAERRAHVADYAEIVEIRPGEVVTLGGQNAFAASMSM